MLHFSTIQEDTLYCANLMCSLSSLCVSVALAAASPTQPHTRLPRALLLPSVTSSP